MIDKATISPIQELMLEVLAARYRLGEEQWTFSRRFLAAANSLCIMRLVEWKESKDKQHIEVRLAPVGKKMMLHPDYVPPILKERSTK